MTEATEPKDRVLVVDDEENIGALLSATLRLTGFEVDVARDAAEALRAADRFEPDLVILDVMLPDLDGFEVARRLRADGAAPARPLPHRPRRTERPRHRPDLGGDDYVTKPFSIEELIAPGQGRAAPRQGAGPAPRSRVLRYADLELDEETHEVRRGGRPIELSPTEFKLLRYLLANAGRVLTQDQILDHVWNYDFAGDAASSRPTSATCARRSTASNPPLIQTVRGVGYSLREPRSR